MAEGPFTHVIDCRDGLAIDWTQDEPERAAAAERERLELQRERREQSRDMAWARLQTRALAGPPDSTLTVADLRDLLELLG